MLLVFSWGLLIIKRKQNKVRSVFFVLVSDNFEPALMCGCSSEQNGKRGEHSFIHLSEFPPPTELRAHSWRAALELCRPSAVTERYLYISTPEVS